MIKRCGNYVGLACVDGSCPIANADAYASRCMDMIIRCEECFYYKGCEDCALDGTAYCDKGHPEMGAEQRQG